MREGRRSEAYLTAIDKFAGIGLACRRGERPVFAGLDFAVESGGALILTGANGAGKSSLLRLMAGLSRPAAGELTWNRLGVEADAEAHRRRLAYLGHLGGIKPLLTPAEDIGFWLRFREPGLVPGELDRRVAEALAWAGLANLADMPNRFLSAGQRQRLALVRATAQNATLWLLDEPATGLDGAGVAALTARIAAHRAQGGMVIAATHQALEMPQAATLDLDRFARRRRAADELSALLDAVA